MLELECKDPGRTMTACDSCRHHRQKCELEPGKTECGRCQKRGCACVFSKKSKTWAELNEQVHSVPEEVGEVETEPMSPEESVHSADLQTEEGGVLSESTPVSSPSQPNTADHALVRRRRAQRCEKF
jgi:hypothetical protein